MNSSQTTSLTPAKPTESQWAALIKLLADDNPQVYRTVRRTILSWGPDVVNWIQPQRLSSDPVLRRRATEIALHFQKQRTDIQFLAFCLKHGEECELEQGAWLLGATEYPEINIEAYQALLDSYALEMRDRVDFSASANQVLSGINDYLFGELGFAGNESNYYDPENSYLNRVIDRRTGNPANLCLLYLLLARRLALPVAGIALPGHFICRYQGSNDEIFIDVFNRGQLLSKAECIQLLLQGRQGFREEILTPVSTRGILMRSCRNLHQIYLQLGKPEEAMRVQRYLVALAR
ncbi:MAG: transglutaminase-like domain-containing protein [Verrucomicrobiota bacterium]